MKRLRSVAACIVAVAVLAGCVPAIVVENRTRTRVRAVVLQHVICVAVGCTSQYAFSTVLSPLPGQSASVPALEGRYNVEVADEAIWAAYVKAKREELQADLKDPRNLSSSKVRDVTKNLGSILRDFESKAKARCYGMVGNMEEDVLVQVTTAPDGSSLIATCARTAPKKSASP